MYLTMIFLNIFSIHIYQVVSRYHLLIDCMYKEYNMRKIPHHFSAQIHIQGLNNLYCCYCIYFIALHILIIFSQDLNLLHFVPNFFLIFGVLLLKIHKVSNPLCIRFYFLKNYKYSFGSFPFFFYFLR